MRVLIISRRFWPDVIGGGQISALEIAKGQARIGNEVHVLTFSDTLTKKDAPVKESIDGVQITRHHMPRLSLFSRLSNMDYMYRQIAKTAEKTARELKPDVVHLLNFESIPTTARRIKKRLGMPVVATVNGPLFGCFTQDGLHHDGTTCIGCPTGKRFRDCLHKWGTIKGPIYWLYSLYHMPRLKMAYRYVDRFLAVSRAMKTLLLAMGVPEEKISVVPNPIDVQTSPPSPSLKIQIGIKTPHTILYAGRLEQDKGIHTTIKSLAHVKDATLIVIGKGSYEANLKQIAKDAGVSERVKFLGFMPHEKLLPHYTIADLVVFPNTIYESLSRMLLEASAHGVPIIASRAGGNADVVDDGITGVLLERPTPQQLALAIRTLLDDKGMRERMGNAARRKVTQYFQPGRIAREISRTYAEILDGTHKPA